MLLVNISHRLNTEALGFVHGFCTFHPAALKQMPVQTLEVPHCQFFQVLSNNLNLPPDGLELFFDDYDSVFERS